MSNSISDEYTHLFMEVQQRIRSAQYEALKAVNREMINLYIDPNQVFMAICFALQQYPLYVRQINSYLISLEAENG